MSTTASQSLYRRHLQSGDLLAVVRLANTPDNYKRDIPKFTLLEYPLITSLCYSVIIQLKILFIIKY